MRRAFFKKAANFIFYIIIIALIVEGSYRVLRLLQYRSSDVFLYPATVETWIKGAYSIEFKPRRVVRRKAQYVLKSHMTLSQFMRLTELCYKNRFGEVNVRVNGFVNYAVPKHRNEIRIIALGESSTYGEVNDDQTFPVYLEKMLSRAYKNVKITVINGGESGKNIEERKDQFRFLFQDFSPDIVIVYAGHNSVALPNPLEIKDSALNRNTKLSRFSFPERFSLVYKDVFETVRFIMVNNERGRVLKSLPCVSPDAAAGLKNEFDDQVASFRNNVEELAQITNKMSAILVLSNQLIWVNKFPIFKDRALIESLDRKLADNPQGLLAEEGFYLLHEKLMNTLSEIAQRHKDVFWLDLYPDFRSVKPQEVLQDRVHQTPLGNRMVAKSMADFIISNKLIEAAAMKKSGGLEAITNLTKDLSQTDIAVAKALKLLARSFVQGMPLEKFKKKQIKSISKKSEEDFNRRFRKVYDELEETGITKSFNLPADLTKQEAIKRIGALTKDDLLFAVDIVPDYLIANKVKDYFNKQKKRSGGDEKGYIERVKDLFNKATKDSIN
jgi:lysophospholipase L1-like esterase